MAEFSSLNGYAVKDTVARNIAKGRNQALAYSNYEAMVDALNTMDNDEFKTGQNIYIGTVGVPDLWVYTVEPVRNTFGYVSDEAIVELLKNNVTIQVGFYKLAMLEGQKVDLTKYDERITANANAITANANAISEQNKNIISMRTPVTLYEGAFREGSKVLSDSINNYNWLVICLRISTLTMYDFMFIPKYKFNSSYRYSGYASDYINFSINDKTITIDGAEGGYYIDSICGLR